MIGLELDSDIAEDVKMACLKRGVMVCNLGDNIIRMVPPLIITEADCDKVYEALKESIEEVCA